MYLLGLDIGTSCANCLLITRDGQCRWSAPLLDALALSPSLFPPTKESTEPAGAVSAEA